MSFCNSLVLDGCKCVVSLALIQGWGDAIDRCIAVERYPGDSTSPTGIRYTSAGRRLTDCPLPEDSDSTMQKPTANRTSQS